MAVRSCDAEHVGGTRLARCVKVYVPLGLEPSRARWAFVFRIHIDRDGRGVARLLAFGERHPARGRSVYERAHRRLHGRYPDR